MTSRAEKAANIHEFMCDDPGFGYDWDERWGGPDTVEVEGVTLNVGDYDCSSSTITAWRKALEGTPYEGSLDAATYTGNMRSVFVGSGLFDWVDVSEAERGDLYLNETHHVAMCQGDGMLSEFSGNEHGGVYGGERGDQTGWESHVQGYYWYPWDGCLKYNGAADTDDDESEETEMQAIYRPDGKDYMVWFDGTTLHALDNPYEMEAVQNFYRECTGKEIPVFEFGTEEAPWGHRFEDAVQHGFSQAHM